MCTRRVGFAAGSGACKRSGVLPVMAAAGLLGLWLLAALNWPQAGVATALAAGAVFVIWAAWRVQGDGAHLLCALVLIELLCSATVLPVTEEQRFLIRYPLLLLFGVPAAIGSVRNSLLWRGGFRDYMIYLGWGAISITYSLLPGYSLARVTAAILIFVMTVKLASDVKEPGKWSACSSGSLSGSAWSGWGLPLRWLRRRTNWRGARKN